MSIVLIYKQLLLCLLTLCLAREELVTVIYPHVLQVKNPCSSMDGGGAGGGLASLMELQAGLGNLINDLCN